ncbi:MAG: hypothetical protein AB7Y46_18630 [Armatimonadota bacterium]
MLLRVGMTDTTRRHGSALLLSGVLLTLVGLGCPHSVTDRQDEPVPTPQETVDWFVRDQALPQWGRFTSYWNHSAAEIRPLDAADRIVAGTVVDIAWTNEIRDAEAFYRTLNTGKQEFRMVANVQAIGGSSGAVSENLRVEYSLIVGVGLTGWDSYALAPGKHYLLLLQRQVGGYRLVPVDEEGPPPIPIAPNAADTAGDASQPDGITRLLVASLRARDGEVSRYAVPVLGHLAAAYGLQDALGELLAVAQGDDEVLTVAAIESLTASGSARADVHRVLVPQTDSEIPAIRAAAIVARLDCRDTSVLPAIVAWSRDVGAPAAIVERMAAGLRALPEQVIVPEVLPHADALLETTIPVPIRRAVAWKLAEHAGVEVAPVLASALHDPDARVAHEAMMGLFRAANGRDNPEMRQHIAAMTEFERDRDRYVGYWAAWWDRVREGWPREGDQRGGGTEPPEQPGMQPSAPPGGEPGRGQMEPAQEPGMRPWPPPADEPEG